MSPRNDLDDEVPELLALCLPRKGGRCLGQAQQWPLRVLP